MPRAGLCRSYLRFCAVRADSALTVIPDDAVSARPRAAEWSPDRNLLAGGPARQAGPGYREEASLRG